MALRELFASFGIEVETKDLHKANESIDELKSTITELAEGYALYKVGETFFEWARGAAEAADMVGKTALKIGVGADELQKWQYAGALADVSNETLSQSLGILSRNAYEAAQGGKEQAKAFTALGVSLKDQAGNLKAPGDIMLAVAEKLHAVEEPTKRTALALQVLGRGGKELLPLFEDGAEGIEKLFAEFETTGAGFSEGFIKEATEANDNITRMRFSFQGLRNIIAVQLIPIIDGAVRWITRAVKAFREMSQGTEIVKVTLAALEAAAAVVGAALVAPFAPAIATFGAIALSIAGVVIVAEDLFQLFTGGDSLIGRVLDRFFGFGTAAKFVKQVRDYFQDIKVVVQWLIENLGKLKFTNNGYGEDLKKAETSGLMQRQKEMGDVSVYEPKLSDLPGKIKSLFFGAPSVPASAVTNNHNSATMNKGTTTYAPQITINASSADAKQVGRIVEEKLQSTYADAFSAVKPVAP